MQRLYKLQFTTLHIFQKTANGGFFFGLFCGKIRKSRKKEAAAVKNCIIFCAGGFDSLAVPIPEEALVIAADGGLRHTQSLGIIPNVILGDFDSLGYVPEGANVYPVEKDDTDAMLAVRCGLEQGCDTFYIYGGLEGSRLDHTVANFQTLQFLADRGARGYLIGKDYIITVLKNSAIAFEKAEGIVSVFCMGPDAHGVTLSGLGYPLEDGVLSAGFPLGVSNYFTEKSAQIQVKDGSLLVLWDRKNGFPG